MQKVIFITGATDGIGFETARALVKLGHHVIVHGRNPEKCQHTVDELKAINPNALVESIVADLCDLTAVTSMTREVAERYGKIDVLINNAGIYNTPDPVNKDGLDVRFVVNTVAPYLLTKELLPLLTQSGRVVNLSSAAQAPVNVDAIGTNLNLSDGEAYAQSKLALTMWSRYLGLANKTSGPMIVSVNPKSLLGSKMVKEAYGIAGGNLQLGADILVKAALSDEFAQAHGLYFDNDVEKFAPPHVQALDDHHVSKIIQAVESVIQRFA